MPPRRSGASKRQDAELTKRMNQFMAMDFDIFSRYTNVTDIIEREFTAANPGERLTDDQLFERQEEYFAKVSDLNSWRKNGALSELVIIDEREMEQYETTVAEIPLDDEVSQYDWLFGVFRSYTEILLL